MYAVGDEIKHGTYRGFIVTKITNGWYHVYHPLNLKPHGSCVSIEEATTTIRWLWAEVPGDRA